MLSEKFQCPDCRGTLREGPDALSCASCGELYPLTGGIADFPRGAAPPGPEIDQRAEDPMPAALLSRIRAAAGARWPAALGSVLEFGCGTGLFSRDLLASGLAREVAFTDPSPRLLRECQDQLRQLGLLEDMRTVAFAVHGAHEPSLRDISFDTCAGIGVLHHAASPRAVLVEAYRTLRPGGQAFFVEPCLRFHRAFAQALADVLAVMLQRHPDGGHTYPLVNWIAWQRQVLLHQGDRGFLAGLAGKHQFDGASFCDWARGLGFVTADALPLDPDPTGVDTARALCTMLGVPGPVAEEIAQLMPGVGARYMGLLSHADSSRGLLLWLTKARGPGVRLHEANRTAPSLAPVPADAGGARPRWHLEVAVQTTETGAVVGVRGWCLSNVDVIWLRVTLGGGTVRIPVWRPRPDVHTAVNTSGQYAAWNAICSGVDAMLPIPATPGEDGTYGLDVVLELPGGAELVLPSAPRLAAGDTVALAG